MTPKQARRRVGHSDIVESPSPPVHPEMKRAREMEKYQTDKSWGEKLVADAGREVGVPSGRVSPQSELLLALSARCEREGPSRFLDWAIHDTILCQVGTGAYGNHPHYTTSLDAAGRFTQMRLAGKTTEPMARCAAALRALAAVAERTQASDTRPKGNPIPDREAGEG